MSIELIEAARLLKFDPALGWPETMGQGAIAKLQTWPEDGRSKDWEQQATDWRALLELAMRIGAVEFTVTDSKNMVELAAILRRHGRDSKATEAEACKLHRIAAPALAAWMQTQHIEPSRHIAAWFSARAVPIPKSSLAKKDASLSKHGRVLTRKALIDELRHEWTTIEADLNEASKKGYEQLKAANVSHGKWDVGVAREWAENQGKLKRVSPAWLGTIKRHSMDT